MANILRIVQVQKRKGVIPRRVSGHAVKYRVIPPSAVSSIRTVLNRRLEGTIISVLLASIFWGALSVAIAAPAGIKILHGHVPATVAQLQPKGTLPPTNRLHLAIGLPLRNTNELDEFLARVYDPASANFHQYLTPQQFTEQFGPADADYASVMEFTKQNHLTIEGTHKNKLLLDVSGSVEDVENAFHVTMRVYQHPTEARDFYAPDTEPSVSADLPITDISGLNNYVRPHPKSIKRSPEVQSNLASGPGSGPGGAYIGNDFRAAYLPGVSLTGSGQSVGMLEFDGYYSNDIVRYENSAGLPAVPLQTVLLDGYDGTPTTGMFSGNPEVSLDIEMAVSMAPGLSSIVVFEAGPDGSVNDILNTMASSNQVLQLSCSWGWGGGPNSTTDNIFKEMAAQGQSFFTASGDSDAYTIGSSSENGVDNPSLDNAPSSSPYVTSVGGTTLTTTGPGGSWSSETVWNWGLDNGSYVGSSGGISSYYSIPSWQANVSMASNGGSTTHRNLPDVALTADNIYVAYGNGSGGALGGTSCATPLWAALTALMNEQTFEGGRAPVGFINPAIYAIGESGAYGGSFHDVTTGDDSWPSSPNGFYAVSGYDLCTGWGTPNGQALIDAIAGLPDALRISPATGFTAGGLVGGPFNVVSTVLQLTNASTNSLQWSLINTSSWLQVSSTGGTLAAGSTDSVTVTLSATADTLTAGTYEAELEFTNWDSQVVQSIPFRLNIADSLVQNGGFETGDFTDWTLVGDTPIPTPTGLIIYNAVESSTDYPLAVHSGNYGASLGDFHLATLSQTLATVPGQSYLLSLWLDNPTNGATQEFEINWNGKNIYKIISPPAFAWTNLQFMVTAGSANTVLQFVAENKPAYFGLDDVSVKPNPGATGIAGSTPISNSVITNAWQLALAGTSSGLKDTGTAFIAFNGDGSYTGYGLSTLSTGMFTFSGTWALGVSGTITGTFNKSPQLVSGIVTGKASTKQVALSVAASNGTYKLNGKPVSMGNLPDFSGSWSVTLKTPHTNIVDSISITSTRGYPGLFEIVGGTNDIYGLSGQALETATGGLTMYIDSTSLGDAAALIGKFNLVSQTASLSGKDQNKNGVTMKLTRP